MKTNFIMVLAGAGAASANAVSWATENQQAIAAYVGITTAACILLRTLWGFYKDIRIMQEEKRHNIAMEPPKD